MPVLRSGWVLAASAALLAAQEPTPPGRSTDAPRTPPAPPTEPDPPATTAHGRAAPDPESGTGAPRLVLPGIRQLTIGGEYRLRFEDRLNYDFDRDRAFDSEFFVQRLRVNLDFQLDDDWRVFVQIQDARFWGEEEGLTIDRASPGLDLHQAFLEVRDPDWIGGETRIGRQILSYGEERLIGPLDWLNQGRTFNALRQRWAGDGERPAWSVDLFGSQLSETPRTTATEDDAVFLGSYATFAIGDGGDVVDAYALLLQDDETATGGEETRGTLGARIVRHLAGIELGAEVATQFGEEDDADIPIGETFAAHVHAKLPLTGDGGTFVRAEFDIASGDDAGTSDDERFDNLFPTAHAFLGVMDLVLWENIVHGGIQFTTTTGRHGRLTVAAHRFDAYAAGDGVGGPAGTLFSGGPGFARDLGYEFDVVWRRNLPQVGHAFYPHIELGYGLFLAGAGVADSIGGNDAAHFVYVQTGVRF